MNARYLIIPFVLQIILIGFDELYCHHQRGLPMWERIGHPLDTLTVLACLGWAYFVPPTSHNVAVYAALSIFSSVFVLKDENVHRRECGVLESWLHTIVLTLHPLVLVAGGFLWPALHARTLELLHYEGFERTFWQVELGLLVLFTTYEVVYWLMLYDPAKQADKQAKIAEMINAVRPQVAPWLTAFSKSNQG